MLRSKHPYNATKSPSLCVLTLRSQATPAIWHSHTPFTHCIRSFRFKRLAVATNTTKVTDMRPQNLTYPDPQGIHVIDRNGQLKWIEAPFSACCIQDTGNQKLTV